LWFLLTATENAFRQMISKMREKLFLKEPNRNTGVDAQ
jgi:hypothetical protein